MKDQTDMDNYVDQPDQDPDHDPDFDHYENYDVKNDPNSAGTSSSQEAPVSPTLLQDSNELDNQNQ